MDFGTYLQQASASAWDKMPILKHFDNPFREGNSSEANYNNSLMNQAALQQMDYQTNSAERAMSFSAEQARLNREWQERMSNTSYQRAAADLEAAGFNPLLAITHGGASTPSGSSAQGVAQSGAMANVDTQDWASMKRSSYGQLLAGVGNMVSSSAQMIDTLASVIPGRKSSFGFGK